MLAFCRSWLIRPQRIQQIFSFAENVSTARAALFRVNQLLKHFKIPSQGWINRGYCMSVAPGDMGVFEATGLPLAATAARSSF